MASTGPNKRDLKELIELAKSTPIQPQEELVEDDPATVVQKFVLIFKIKEGNNQVLSRAIYDVYKTWAKDPISKKSFATEFSKLFNSLNIGGTKYYKINYKPLQLVNKGRQLKDKRNES